MPGMCRGFNFPPIHGHIISDYTLRVFLTFHYFYVHYLICRCACTFTRINQSPSHIFQFQQNNSQLLFHIMVSLQGAGAFSRDLKIEKLIAPLFPDPRGAGDTNDWCITQNNKQKYIGNLFFNETKNTNFLYVFAFIVNCIMNNVVLKYFLNLHNIRHVFSISCLRLLVLLSHFQRRYIFHN